MRRLTDFLQVVSGVVGALLLWMGISWLLEWPDEISMGPIFAFGVSLALAYAMVRRLP